MLNNKQHLSAIITYILAHCALSLTHFLQHSLVNHFIWYNNTVNWSLNLFIHFIELFKLYVYLNIFFVYKTKYKHFITLIISHSKNTHNAKSLLYSIVQWFLLSFDDLKAYSLITHHTSCQGFARRTPDSSTSSHPNNNK